MGMLYQGRYLFKWLNLGFSIIAIATSLLGLIFYLPSITSGPTSLDYLNRGKCHLNNVSYVEQKCHGGDDGFINPYSQSWKDCYLLRLEMFTSDYNFTCHWYSPESYDSERTAFAEFRRNYRVDSDINCVVDTLNEFCYPEAEEVKDILLITIIPFVLGLIFLSVFLYLQYYNKNWIFGDK